VSLLLLCVLVSKVTMARSISSCWKVTRTCDRTRG